MSMRIGRKNYFTFHECGRVGGGGGQQIRTPADKWDGPGGGGGGVENGQQIADVL